MKYDQCVIIFGHGRYKLEQVTINGRIKDAMVEFKQTHPHIKAVIMGTRRSDPYSSKSLSNVIMSTLWIRVCSMIEYN